MCLGPSIQDSARFLLHIPGLPIWGVSDSHIMRLDVEQSRFHDCDQVCLIYLKLPFAHA